LRRNRFLLAALFPLMTVPAHAADTTSLPAAVAAGLKSIADTCTEVGGKPLTANAVERADLDGDGKEDFVLSVGSVDCEGAPGVYGDREKSVVVYVGDGAGGAKEAFSDSVYGARIEGTGSAAKLWLTVSAELCGRKRSANFATESFCDRPLAWNAGKQSFEYAPVSTVRMIE
jgi:hypothetical protein